MKLIFTPLLVVLTTVAFAQTTISGKVTDEKGEAIPGANIVVRDTYDGASTAVDGNFIFITEEKGIHTIDVTFVGYKPVGKQVEIAGTSLALNVILKEEINQLDAVVISAGSFTAGEEKRRTILKAVDIATTAGATADIAGALNTLPGTQKVGESGRLFVRGGDGREARTFIDGMAVLDAYGPSAPNTPSRGRFLPFMFKGTSFSTGGYSAEYGQALSSALVLSSKDKAEMNQTDIGILSVGADVAQTIAGDRSSWTGKIQYTNITPYFGLIRQRVDWYSPPVSTEGSTAYRQQVGKDGMLKFFGNFNHSNLAMYNHDIAVPEIKQLYDLTNKYGYGNGSYQQTLNDRWNVRGGLSYTYNSNDLKVDGLPASETEKGMHAKVVVENTISDKVEVRFGTETIGRSYTAQQEQSVSFNENIYAAFAESEAYANKHLVAKAGARIEYNSLNGQTGIDPRLSVAYKPGEKGQFSFAYGRFRQSAANQYVRVNTDLKSEKAEHFIVNYQVINNNRTFRVEAYYKKYDALVKFDGGDVNLPANSGDGFARGVELFWRDNKTIKNVDYWVSYSFLDTERDYLNFPYSATPSFASKHNFSVVYKHFITALKSQLGLTYSFGSGRPYYDPNAVKFNGSLTPYYQDVSANISYLPRNWLIVYASCTNLLGRENIFGYQYATTPDANGVYAGRALRQAANRFLFMGVFITISKNKSVNQLPNL
ncbi:MAG TPA: TonB-dependent receptor [Cyclobacteriaceae bacterium]|nr:TonB-dependent receptor [Cyclobacteriaceae bacterium]